jgi:hypothetical protein
MAWKCADCGSKEKGESKMPICHHCGKPVCKKHREMITDDAFSVSADPTATRVAVHCLDCRASFHPEATNMEPGSPSAQGLSVA